MQFIKSIKSDSKDFHIITQHFNFCPFKLSIHQTLLNFFLNWNNFVKLFSTLLMIRDVSLAPNHHVRMIYEGCM